jgi:hypothetical protein
MPTAPTTAEAARLTADHARTALWRRWGPYLSERQWGTVREDYSPDGACWTSFPHDHARSRAYRWGEDGLLGVCDRQCRLCFSVALWNGKDPILKERLFGLTGPEGNHGEDVKEEYFYLDSTPTHSFMRAMYRYPHAAFPYDQLVAANARRGRDEPEFELADTGVLDGLAFCDVEAEYAKAGPNDLLIRLTVRNRQTDPDAPPAEVHLVPQLWFRNTWSFGGSGENIWSKPAFGAVAPGPGEHVRLDSIHESLGHFRFVAERAVGPGGEPVDGRVIFTENQTNPRRIFGKEPEAGERYFKDAFDRLIVQGEGDAVNTALTGSKGGVWYRFSLPPGGVATVRLRLTETADIDGPAFGTGFQRVFADRAREADEFYDALTEERISTPEHRLIARRAYAGLLWSKQFYQYIVRDWLAGDPGMDPPPDPRRMQGRNGDWSHVYCYDIISMPDKWEYPWFAAWDLAFHCVALAKVDPDFAKDQLLLMLREWYMHPSGAIPAYEFSFGDVNPPVHAWACWRVYKMTGKRGERDRAFLVRCFHKLLLNFTWWVNRKDPGGRHLFSGGFLGLDNIGVFDRGQPLPGGGVLEQADGTAWMAFYCGTMLSISLELAQHDPAYEDVASKFFEHFVAIIDAVNAFGGTGLWDDEDGFYYDHIRGGELAKEHELGGDGESLPLRIRSLVGLIPLLAVEVAEDSVIDRFPDFRKRMEWFLRYHTDLAKHIGRMGISADEAHGHKLLAIPSRERLERVLRYLLDENEFLSPFGVRSLSKVHKDRPYVLARDGHEARVEYTPGESDTGMFGGNSNWRGPVWFPLNFLIIEALERYHHFYAGSLKVELPTGSGRFVELDEASMEIRRRLIALFERDKRGIRPCTGLDARFAAGGPDPDLFHFHEYFHGETGQGLGASHQTGWTALIAILLQDTRPHSGPHAPRT